MIIPVDTVCLSRLHHLNLPAFAEDGRRALAILLPVRRETHRSHRLEKNSPKNMNTCHAVYARSCITAREPNHLPIRSKRFRSGT
jgi:hypothetical protein